MLRAYQVNDWEKHFEGAKSKGYKNKTSCQLPTKHGLGYRKLIRSKDGAALFGAWCALIQVLSRHESPRQGYLTDTGRDDGIPLSSDDLFLLTDIPSVTFDKMLEICSSTRIGWINQPHKDTTGIPQGTDADTSGPLDLDLDLDSDLDLDYSTSTIADSGASGYTAEFDDFWKYYGRKGSKKNAWKAWKNLSVADKDSALKAVPYYFQERPDAQYRKDTQGYLNQKVFESVLERMEAGCLELPQKRGLSGAPAAPRTPGLGRALTPEECKAQGTK